MTSVRLEPAASRFRVKHSTTEPLRSLERCSKDDLDRDTLARETLNTEMFCLFVLMLYDPVIKFSVMLGQFP